MKNKSLKVLFIYNGIFVFAGSFFGPLYAVYVGILDKSILSISITWSVFLIASLIFTLILSKIGDGVKEKEYLLMAGFFVRAIAWFLFIFVTDISGLIFLQIILGLGEALGSPAFDAIFAEHLDCDKHIEEYANWKLVLNGATGIGTIIGGLIATKFGFSWLFATMSLLAVVSFIGVLLQPRKLL